ncbi:MAG: methyltransferase domain-containing protein [Planctomycetota bacterium]
MPLPRTILALLTLASLAASSAGRAQDTIQPAQLGETKVVKKYDKWLFASQPSEKDLAAAKEAGVQRVITLRNPAELRWDEAKAVRELEMEFSQLPVDFPDGLTSDKLNEVCVALEDAEGKPALLHCGSAVRVGAVWMAYRATRQNIPLEQAQAEAEAIGLKSPEAIETIKAYVLAWREANPPRSHPLPPDINKDFLDPNMDVQRWIERFELESREIFAGRQAILKATGVKPGQRIADIGAGTGLFTKLFAEATGPNGWVYAVDISPNFIQHIRGQLDKSEILFVSPILSSQKSITLPPDSVDLAFICDTYHHFEFVPETMQSIHAALRTGGTLVVIDFERLPGKSRQWVIDHVRGDKSQFREEIEAAGFEFVEEVEIPEFAENYLQKFKKN